MTTARPAVVWLGCLLAATVLLSSADRACAQRKRIPAQRFDKSLNDHWRNACERVRDGDPWGDIADDLEVAVGAAGEGRVKPEINMYLAALRAAEREADTMPTNRMDVAPEELIQLLTESRLIRGQRGFNMLLSAPLHTHRESATVQRLHWDQLASPKEHESTDPVVRVLHRGRSMIPYLIDALEDMTATRCTFITAPGPRLAVMYLRGELAMALLEAVSRCRFYTTERGKRFVEISEAARSAAVQSAREWWEATKDLPEIEARSWLISRIDFAQAAEMISLLITQHHTARAIDHLRDFLIAPDGRVEFQAAKALASLGDPSGLRALCDQIRAQQKISVAEAKWLMSFGRNREFAFLHELLRAGLETDGGKVNSISSNILAAAATVAESRMVVPLMALALDPDDHIILGTGFPRNLQQRLPNKPTRADLAALVIQDVTKRDFRYDSDARPEFRKKGIHRVKEWWDREGHALYRYQYARSPRRRDIR